MPVGRDKQEELARKLEAAGVYEDDLVERFVRGGGHGGQKLQKSSNAVYLCHLPTGTEVKVHTSRSQATNRYLARQRLLTQLLAETEEAKAAARQQTERIRRQKRKRSKRAKEKMLAAKRERSERKTMRRRPHEDEER